MFVCVARVVLDVPAAGSLKAKRQVVRRVTDRVKAKFNVAVAEVEDNDAWNRAVIALAVVGNERRHVNEQMDKIFAFIDDMYAAPVSSKDLEILSFGEDLFGDNGEGGEGRLSIPKGERSLAEAEGLGAWEQRHEKSAPVPRPSAPVKNGRAKSDPKPSLSDARAMARGLRNRREWEKGKP